MRLRALAAALATLAVAGNKRTCRTDPWHSAGGPPTGTPAADGINAGAGDDVLSGRGGADKLQGGPGDDSIAGMAGGDTISGGTGADTSPADPRPDRLAGGAGRDLIRARHGGRDRVDCGAGRDTAILDSRDLAVRCEVVRRPPAVKPAKPASTTPQGRTSSRPQVPTADCRRPTPPASPLRTRPRRTRRLTPRSTPRSTRPITRRPPMTIRSCSPRVTSPTAPRAPSRPPPCSTACAARSRRSATPHIQVAPSRTSRTATTRPGDATSTARGRRSATTNTTRPAPFRYWDYFGAAAGEAGKGWYSYDLGSWHVVVLNGNCSEVGGCGEGSPQYEWLRADLAANPSHCTAAYWDTPRFSSGQRHGNDLNFVPFWQALYEHGAEFVMGGNDHHYERFAPRRRSVTSTSPTASGSSSSAPVAASCAR